MQQKPHKSNAGAPRHARIDRVEPVEINSEESHLWAISYSDLLMVLMSFFIIFFSVDEEKRDDVIQEIAMNIGQKGTSAQAAKTAPNAGATPSENIEGYMQQITASLKDKSSVSFAEIKDGSIHVQFAENTFQVRGYHLTKALKRDIADLMSSTKPFADRIRVTFIGHSDSKPLVVRGDGIIKDNYVLSALRANEAMQYAATLGVPADTLYLQGSAHNTLNSRTISVRIERRY